MDDAVGASCGETQTTVIGTIVRRVATRFVQHRIRTRWPIACLIELSDLSSLCTIFRFCWQSRFLHRPSAACGCNVLSLLWIAFKSFRENRENQVNDGVKLSVHQAGPAQVPRCVCVWTCHAAHSLHGITFSGIWTASGQS